jgi:hypothetical protein
VSRSSQSFAIKNVLDVLRQKCRKAKATAKNQRRAEGGVSEPEGQDVPEGAPAVKVSRGRQALGLGSGNALQKSLPPKETQRLKVGLAKGLAKLDWRKIKIDDDEVLAATTRSGLRVPIIFKDGQETNFTKVMNYIKDQFDDPSVVAEDEVQAPVGGQTDRRVEWNEQQGRVVVRWTDSATRRKVDSKQFVVGPLSADGAPLNRWSHMRERKRQCS